MSFISHHCSLHSLNEMDDMAGFSCGDNDLDSFFINDCFNFSKQLLGKTYYYQMTECPKSIVGAFTIANSSIRVSKLPNARRKKIEANIPYEKSLKDYPAVLIGRLGVSKGYHSLHIGSDIIEYLKYWFIEPRNKTGCRFILVEAYNRAETLSFYEKNGFRPVFSTEAQEKEFQGVQECKDLKTRLLFFDLLTVTNAPL